MDYKDIAKSYDEYVYFQTQKYSSHESEFARWSFGQKRYIEHNFAGIDRNEKIADIACGDGIGLRVFKELGFSNVCGVEFNKDKAKIAKETGYNIYESDMHNLGVFKNSEFDIVYSSHTLEHAFFPTVAVNEFNRILKPHGLLFVVLPYPDTGNDEAHGGKYELGTNILDDGKTVIEFFSKLGFNLKRLAFDRYREPEIWLTMQK